MKWLLKSKRIRSLVLVAIIGAILEALSIAADKVDVQQGAELIEALIRVLQAMSIWFVGLKTPTADDEELKQSYKAICGTIKE